MADTLLHLVELVLCFTMFSMLTFAVRSFARGAQSFHVFAGGFVHRRNGRSRAYAWPQVAELRPVLKRRGDDAGKLQSYQLVLRDGGAVTVPVEIVDGRDPFLDHLMGLLDRHGIPVS